jgi:pyruvate dehydrogenase E2 component (dihydrolipoamide acetyltransferase)
MTVTLSMPQLGLTMTEATVGTWLKKPGDAVRKDEALLSISTDKVDMDVESNVDGVLREILVEEGQTVPVGTPLAHIDAVGKAPLATTPLAAPLLEAVVDAIVSNDSAKNPPVLTGNSVQKDRTPEKNEPGEAFRSSPRARRRARELGIDIASVQGSGPEGRVVEEDLLNLAPVRTAASNSDSKRRQLIADSMVESVRTIPPFSVSLEVNANKLDSLYQSLREPISRSAGAKLTYTDILLRALAISLAETPTMNAVWVAGEVNPRSGIVLGLAVATDRGVVAPVLADVNHLSLAQLVTRRAELTDKARQSRLTFADLEGGVGTLSNLGMYRVDRFEGIISPGQSFILATGKLRNRPWVEDNSLVVRQTVILNLSVDHRVADGAVASLFLERIAEVIENPYRVLWNE